VGPRRPVPPAEEGAQTPHRPPALQAPESLTGERFPRRARLARGSDLTACWERGRRVHGPRLDLAWRPSPAGHARSAIVVPRFQFTAVARNRLRRRLREILRRQLASLPAVDLVVRANRAAYAAPFATLVAELTESVRCVT
jgi:ribonuclease P protein component